MIPADITIEHLNKLRKDTLVEHLGIEYTAIGADYIEAIMPVDHRSHQPQGILHGGASAALAETLGSVGSYLCIDPSKFRSVGIEINANHIRSVSSGFVTGKAMLVHKGRRTHVWEIRIVNNENKLVCISRLTVAIIPVDPNAI